MKEIDEFIERHKKIIKNMKDKIYLWRLEVPFWTGITISNIGFMMGKIFIPTIWLIFSIFIFIRGNKKC